VKRALFATLLLEGLDLAERRLLGHRPAYDTAEIGKRLFGSARGGELLRWIYGPALASVQRRLRIRPLIFGPLVALAELLALPLCGATPPLSKWRKGEVPLLFAHATAFALAAGMP
jgi:hypothetical protein